LTAQRLIQGLAGMLGWATIIGMPAGDAAGHGDPTNT
jgi:hypothetical protein